jgi:hypothetical protein
MTSALQTIVDPDEQPLIDGTSDTSAGRRPFADRRICVLLFAGMFATYLAVTRGTFYAYDAQAMVAVTKGIVDHASLKTTGVGFNDVFHISTPYAPYGLAQSVLAVPFYAVSKVTGNAPLLVSLLNPVLMACAVVLVYKTARVLGWRAVHAMTAAIGFGLFTQALQATTEFFSEPGVTLCVVAMVYGVVAWGREDDRAPLWIGLAAAGAIQFRPDSLLTVWIGLLAVPLFVPWSRLWRRRPLLLAGVPMACSLVLLVWYNELRDHKVFVGAYGGLGFTTPLGYGLHGLLFDPGKSIFIFNALAIPGAVGLVALLFRNRPVAVLYLLLIVPRIIFFAKWSAWDGGWSWGPRFLLPTVPLFVLAAVELLRVWERRSVPGIVLRCAAVVLVLFSATVNFLSVRVPYQQWLEVLWTPPTLAKLGMHPSTLTQAQQSYDYHNQFSTGPLWGDVVLLRHHLAVMGPDLWARGHAAFGIILLALAAVCLVVAVLHAMAEDERPGENQPAIT